MTNADELKRILFLVATNDPAAPGEIRHLAHKLLSLAERLEAGQQNDTRSTGGIGDRVRMQVIGPDGQMKQDTGS